MDPSVAWNRGKDRDPAASVPVRIGCVPSQGKQNHGKHVPLAKAVPEEGGVSLQDFSRDHFWQLSGRLYPEKNILYSSSSLCLLLPLSV